MRPIPTPHIRTKLTKTGESIRRGRRMAEASASWMEANREGFEGIYRYVKLLQAGRFRGRVRDRVAAWCVDHRITVGPGEDYRFANGVWAGISRYLVVRDRSLDGAPIVLRDSDIDCYGLLPVSYLPETQGKE